MGAHNDDRNEVLGARDIDKGGTSVDFVGSLRNLYRLNVLAQL